MNTANELWTKGQTPGRLALIFGALLLAAANSGCAVGNKHSYAGAPPELLVSGNHSTAVAVQDQRPYILNGDKDEDFVGLQRGGFGNPFDVTTESGKSLASDMCSTVVAALQKRDVRAVPVGTSPKASEVETTQLLLSTSGDRLLYIKLVEWKADTYQNTALIFDIRLTVMDSEGTLLAENARQGEDDLGGSFMNPPAHAKTAVPTAFRRIIESLLNDPKVLAALQS